MVVDALKGYVQLASGLTEVTKDRAVAAVQALAAQRPDLFSTAGSLAGQVQGAAEDLWSTSRDNRALLVGLIRTEVERAVAALGFAKEAEVEALRHEVDTLARERSEDHTEPGDDATASLRAALAPPKPATRRAPTKPAAKKAPAKKSAAKKAPAKDAPAKKVSPEPAGDPQVSATRVPASATPADVTPAGETAAAGSVRPTDAPVVPGTATPSAEQAVASPPPRLVDLTAIDADAPSAAQGAGESPGSGGTTA